LFSTIAYPLVYVCSVVCFSLFAMIMNLLMGADVRTPRDHQGDGGSAA